MARVIVVGAGMGGLAVSARLAAQGHTVQVFEQSHTHGGKVARHDRDGFRFDTGPSLVTLPAVYRDLFLKTAVRRANASLEDNLDLQALDPAFGYHWADGSAAVLPGANHARVATALDAALGNDTGQQWNAFSQRAAAMWAATRVAFLENPLSGRDLLRYSRRFVDLRTVAPWSSLRGLGKHYLTDPRLRVMLDRYATYAGSDPRRAPAALGVIPYVEQTFGAWHIGGGVRGLADALFERCLERGVQFAFETDVTAILTSVQSVEAVQLADGSTRSADVVVANADASHVYGRLVTDPRARRPLQALQRTTPSMAGFAMMLALRGRTPGIQHHNVWFSDDYDAEFDAVFDGRVAADPTIYACVPDDPLMRPNSDHEGWSVLVNAPRHDPAHGFDWTSPGVADDYADRVLRLLAARSSDVADRVLWREIRTPADLARDTRSPGGSIYGTSSNGARAAFLRPANRSPVPGLFLVGGSAHPGGGLPLVGLGAAIVAQQIGPA